MASAAQFWKPIINDFNPVGPARLEEVRRFFIDRHEDDPTRSVLQRLKSNFQDSIDGAKPHKALLTGYVGCGKSSELLRLSEELAGDFFVVHLDAETTLYLDSANQFDIILAIGLAVHIAAGQSDIHSTGGLLKELIESLARNMGKPESNALMGIDVAQLLGKVAAFVGASAAGGAVGGVAGAVGAAAAATKLELKVSDKLIKSLEMPANREKVMGSLNKLINEVKKACQRPMLIVVDGLDKVSTERARLLFAESALLTEPDCALIYAAPIEFYFRLAAGQATNLFDEYRMLNNPCVHERPPVGDDWKKIRVRNEPAIAVLGKVVSKRLANHGKQLSEVITREAFDLLAAMSGGVMREMIRSFREAARFARLKNQLLIDEAIARKVVNESRQTIGLRLTKDLRDALRSVLREGALSGGKNEAIEDQLIHGLHLLSYKDENENSWFDAHPNILELL